MESNDVAIGSHGHNFPSGALSARGPLGAFASHGLPRPVTLATYNGLEAPWRGAISNGYRAHIYPRVTGIWSSPQTSVHCLTCCTPQTRAKCCLELTAVSGYRMFLGPFM